jgi:hypothetical protein
VLLALAVGSVACAQREVSDGDMAAQPVEHPPELLERFDEACEDWCMVIDECGLYGGSCSCEERDFSEKHALCVEKAALVLECKAALTCEEAYRLDGDSIQDRPCYGEAIAEAAAC